MGSCSHAFDDERRKRRLVGLSARVSRRAAMGEGVEESGMVQPHKSRDGMKGSHNIVAHLWGENQLHLPAAGGTRSDVADLALDGGWQANDRRWLCITCESRGHRQRRWSRNGVPDESV